MNDRMKKLCPNCGGESCIDSGGATPWGSGIDLPCEACNGTGKVEIDWKNATREAYLSRLDKLSLDDVLPFGEPVRHFQPLYLAKAPINIYLDDVRDCPREFLLARTYEECIAMLKGEIYDIPENYTGYYIHTISLDHDLGTEKTGYDVACWIEEQWANGNTDLVQTIYLHTANPTGRDNMYRALAMSRFKPDHVKVYKSPMINDINFGGERA